MIHEAGMQVQHEAAAAGPPGTTVFIRCAVAPQSGATFRAI